MKKITTINNAIQTAINNIASRAVKPMQEPDYNAAVAIELPRLINASGVFPNVQFGGCFIHQSPKATFSGKYNNPATCEVGDLLAICHDVVDGDDRYNAALIQWKILHRGVEKITGTALNQLDLYEHWPKFKLNCCNCLFDILPKTVTPGAQYGLILPGVPADLYCSIPLISLRAENSPSFARFIINLMKWQTGRPVVFNGIHNTADGWSSLVEHLIVASLTKRFNRSNVKLKDVSRSAQDFLKLLVTDDTDKEAIKMPVAEKDDGAISILYIEMAKDKKNNRNRTVNK